jgi:uncharacterized DUF497 family protein
MQFEWDSDNLQHITTDHPERENTVEEVESIFNDPNLIIKAGRKNVNEQRFNAVGMGNSHIKFVVFTINNGLIRPISCWPANRQTTRYYYENIQGK